MSVKLSKTVEIKYKLKCLTGLHIGGSKETFEIGGLDNPVIKLSYSFENNGIEYKEGMPYIPGSSVKGKIRSLLDWKYKTFDVIKEDKGKDRKEIYKAKEKYNSDEVKKIGILFGFPAEKSKEFGLGPARLKFFDAYPTKETIIKWEEELGENIYTEIKIENKIDRLTSAAETRNIERVPAGSVFEGVILFDIFEIDTSTNIDNKELIEIFIDGLKMLEQSFLGGGGSRGNGRVKFVSFELDGKEVSTVDALKDELLKQLGS